ncbi:MAG: methyltransferase domain-containing protein [Magnetospirillum sp.]|jgi:SAM-dependent methyltransferase|nr:methyltransferase domain-containing protein [Magnetospirillum sp.]
MQQAPKTFVHVGCGQNTKQQTTRTFASDAWRELRFDIDPNARPDLVGTMTDMSAVPTGTVDAIFSSHNLEHLYPHEVPLALAEFRRIVKPDGFVVVTCPDLQSVCALVAEGKLTEPAYMSPAGPIAAIDILYGHRPSMKNGNLFMAHRCGFTEKVLMHTLAHGGFPLLATVRRPHPAYDLWAVASGPGRDEHEMRALAAAHFP